MVALHHSLLLVSIDGISNIWMHSFLESLPFEARIAQLLLWLTNGSFAVMIFMVLSGWALGQSLNHHTSTGKDIQRFYTKRFWRLYPVYAVTTCILAWWWLSGQTPIPIPQQSLWWSWWFVGQLTPTDLLKHLLFLSPGLSGVSWTMAMIVLSSLLAPFFASLFRRTKMIDDILIIANLLLVPMVFGQEKYFLIAAFAVGLLYTKYQRYVSGIKVKSWIMVSIILITLALRYLVDTRIAWMGEIVGALFVVDAVLKQSRIMLLENHCVLFLGKISYSFYLWHFLVLYRLTPLLLPVVGQGLPGIFFNSIICIIATIPVAYLSYLILEKWLPKFSSNLI